MGFLKLKKVFGGKKKKNGTKQTVDQLTPTPSATSNNTDAVVVEETTSKAVREHVSSLPPKPPCDSASQKVRYTPSYASGASTPEVHSDEELDTKRAFERKASNPKILSHSTSAIGLDEMIEDRRCDGGLAQNIVHLEVPFGKPIEEVYEGVHSGPVLGSGISGLVRLVTHKATGHKYAVKVLDLGLVDNTEGLQQLREEIFIMCQLDHPNIVRLEEVYESTHEIYLVQELCLGGELFDRLDEQPDYHYTEAECARLVKQMLCAVRYLHSRGIIHRDLKLENFLFSSTSKDSELKMIDFGLSKHFRYGEVQHEAVGTPYTVAPEVIKGTYDERCDIWAIGVITYLLLSGDPPFGGCGGPEPLMQVRANILEGSFAFEPAYIWASVSDLARLFIRDMLKTEPQDRPTARQAQQHSWLQEWASRNKTEDNVLDPNVVKALVNFKEYSDMRKLLCEVLSFTLLPYQIKELRSEFEKMDTDGSGEISLSALKQVLLTNAGAGSLGALTEKEVEDIFNAMRVRKTEARIHWHEFIAAGLSQCQVDDRNLRLAFDRLDSDHKGYIILDDIMDLMGSDALQSEDNMRQMWGDSIKAVRGQQARITYDDFLLLMKGQTKDAPSHELERDLDSGVSQLAGAVPLQAVPESEGASEGSPDRPSIRMKPSFESTSSSGHLPIKTDSHSNLLAFEALRDSHSSPSTPKKSLVGLDSPLSMDDDDDIMTSGPGVPGSLQSLTPPHSPNRGASDYVTPAGSGRICIDFKELGNKSFTLPSLSASSRPLPMYTRGRSLSMDDKDVKAEQDISSIAHVVHDLMLPEVESTKPVLDDLVRDGSKSNLMINRTLYRAHRQMRLAVLDASKRFEEQQAKHARDVIIAVRSENEGPGMIQAGLVMRHGHKKQVSSQAVCALLDRNREQQQALVEKANRRGGRGRRSRKKTISDMSGMLSSMGTEDLSVIAQQQTAEEENDVMDKPIVAAPEEEVEPVPVAVVSDSAIPVELDDLSERGQMRGATVPGEFRKTIDPFGMQGKYGAAAALFQGGK